MNGNLTELVFVLDRSGSMAHLEEDTIGGFNRMIAQQRDGPGDARVTVVLFDTQYEVLYNGMKIEDIPPMTNKQYYARGLTALLDAVGKTIDDVGERLSAMPEEERPGKVVFVITTDGMENASHSYSLEKVKAMVEHQKSKYGWDFLFFGAGIDAVAAASDIGITADRAMRVGATSAGIEESYSCMADFITDFRESPRKKLFENLKMEKKNDRS